MGGTNEKVISPAISASSPLVVANMRIHENNGEVHIHDDAKNNKFACSVADFYSNWKQGKANYFSTPIVMIGHDGKGNPLSAKFEKTIINGQIDIAISFAPVSFGKTVEQIDSFVNGK